MVLIDHCYLILGGQDCVRGGAGGYQGTNAAQGSFCSTASICSRITATEKPWRCSKPAACQQTARLHASNEHSAQFKQRAPLAPNRVCPNTSTGKPAGIYYRSYQQNKVMDGFEA